MPSVTRNVIFAIATSLSMLSISACAGSAHQTRDDRVVPYKEQVLSLRGTPVATAEIFKAAEALLIEREYTVIDKDPNLGYFEVCSPVDDSFGMQTREHWLILISAEKVSVAKSLQERVNGDWLEYAFVDRSYSYASENELLHSIAGAATQLASTEQDLRGTDVAASTTSTAE